MRKDIIIIDQEHTFQELTHLLARAISSIADENDDAVFSMSDVLCLLHNVNEYVAGEFEIRRTHSHSYQIVYKSEDEVIESFKEKWKGFIK